MPKCECRRTGGESSTSDSRERDPKRVSRAHITLCRSSSLRWPGDGIPRSNGGPVHSTGGTLPYRDRARYRVYRKFCYTYDRTCNDKHRGTRPQTRDPPLVCIFGALLERMRMSRRRDITKPDVGGVTNKRDITKPTLFTFTAVCARCALTGAHVGTRNCPI